MNTDLQISAQIVSMQNQITQLTNMIQGLQKQITALKIDKQIVVKAERPIKPGIATKVAYTSNGLISDTLALDVSDIPSLPMDKINGLVDAIDNMPTKSDMDNLEHKVADMLQTTVGTITGTKVTVNKNGLVTSITDLSIEDIPELPISKISTLQEQLNLLQSVKSAEVSSGIGLPKYRAGTGCNISWDDNGRIIASAPLSITDLPETVISRLNTLESMISKLASIKTVDQLKQSINGKLDANSSLVESGTYPKVVIDSKGLVTRGISQLSKTDLPELSMIDIKGLVTELNRKVNVNDIENIIDNKLKSIQTNTNSSVDLTSLKYDIQNKADRVELTALRHEVKELEAKLERSFTAQPIDQLINELNQLKVEISNIIGKISTLEK